MVTWMIHPKHGAHPAVGGEIEGMKANGWTVRAPKVKPEIVEEIAYLDGMTAAIQTQIDNAPRVKRTYNRKAK